MKSSSSAFCTATRPWTRSSITVSPSRGALRRTTNGAPSGPAVAHRAMRCRSGTAAARPAPRRAARPAPPGVSVAAIGVRRARAARARPRRGAPRTATGNMRRRPNRGRASAGRRGSRRSPPGSSAPVGILDPQQELAAVVAGEQPVEQGGAGAADVQEAGRRGREARDDLMFEDCDLRSSALSFVSIAAMQWMSAPNIAGAPLPQRARRLLGVAVRAACAEAVEGLPRARARAVAAVVRRSVSAPASPPGSCSASRAHWAAFLCISGGAGAGRFRCCGGGRAERALGWFALAADARLRAGLGAQSSGCRRAAARAAGGHRVRRRASSGSSTSPAKGTVRLTLAPRPTRSLPPRVRVVDRPQGCARRARAGRA